MSTEALIFWSYSGLALVLLSLIFVVIAFGPQAIREWTPIVNAVIAWGRRTFTKAGDQPPCACDRFHTEVFCVSCRRVRVLTVTSTLSTADSNVLLGHFAEERRRRDAQAAYEEIDPLWEARH